MLKSGSLKTNKQSKISNQCYFAAPFLLPKRPLEGQSGQQTQDSLWLTNNPDLRWYAQWGKQRRNGVFEALAVEKDLLSVTQRLQKSMRENPTFLRLVNHGLTRIQPQNSYRKTRNIKFDRWHAYD